MTVPSADLTGKTFTEGDRKLLDAKGERHYASHQRQC